MGVYVCVNKWRYQEGKCSSRSERQTLTFGQAENYKQNINVSVMKSHHNHSQSLRRTKYTTFHLARCENMLRMEGVNIYIWETIFFMVGGGSLIYFEGFEIVASYFSIEFCH